MKKLFRLVAAACILSLSFSSVSFAHSGRTDAYGGHWNHKTGTYHYHNGGSTIYTTTTKSSTSSSTATKLNTTQTAAVSPAKESDTKVVVNGKAIAGPVLWYKGNYFVPVNQLANSLSAVVSPVNDKLQLPVTQKQPQTVYQTQTVYQPQIVPNFKSNYMDTFVVFVSIMGTDPCYHKIDCPIVEQSGLSAYLAIDEGFIDLGVLDSVSPCQYCIKSF